MSDTETAPIEVWRGAVNSWDCDVMGHMNVRIYVARAMEGMAGIAAALGMPRAFAADADITLEVREHHIRFLREARAGAPLHMTAALESFDPEGEAVVLQRLVHSRSGETAATFRTRAAPVPARAGGEAAWPDQARRLAGALSMETPPEARERGVRPRPERWAASLESAERMGLETGARGAVQAADCDVFGRMRRELVIGRITDAMPWLDIPMREAAAKSHAGAPETIGGASIEFRLAYFDMPEAGAGLVLRSGFAAAGPKVQTMVHWLLDPLSGRAWASAEMVVVSLDLDARKAIALGDEGLEMLQARVVPGLTM